MDNSTSNFKEIKLSSEIKFEGKVVNVRRDDVKISDGQIKFREVVEHPGGVVIVPFLDTNKLAMVKQWRYPIGQELIELPAGKLERGEDPFESAKRELREETGYVAKNWRSLGYIYTAPGFCDERLYMYVATDLSFVGTDFDEGEIIEPFILDINEALDMMKSGKINDAKTIAGINLALLDKTTKI